MTDRLDVRKTYKLFIGGAFPRSESGRTFAVAGADGRHLAHAPLGSRKDLREAVVAARGAQAGWAGRTAYNRAQILYRVAEMLEGRRDQLAGELADAGAPDAGAEVDACVDRWVWYAGWADKITQIAGGANPVAGPYFNLSVPEPTGVVGVVAPDTPALLGLVSRVAPAIVSGNTVVVLASETAPLPALTLAEVLATSDLPGGVVNVLSGRRAELVSWMAGHGDVDAVDLTGVDDLDVRVEAERAASESVTRVVRAVGPEADFAADTAQTPWMVTALCETKTVWHPTGR
ncbi:MAG TPA: aldehyde dehydrogenase family protein [Acidimicrobiales bacterium]|nr:aldehyde dehydrogenase family protein [Acidimicrobiales bacterium]